MKLRLEVKLLHSDLMYEALSSDSDNSALLDDQVF